jgi:predicted PurR-regulated permease PerM
MVICAIIGVIYLGYEIRIVSVPLLLALALAYLFEPLVRWLRKRNLCSRRVAAVGIIVGLVLLFAVPLVIGSGFAVVQGARALTELAADAGKVQKSLESPDDEALRAAVPAGGWLKIRDALAAHKAPPPSPEPQPPAPGGGKPLSDAQGQGGASVFGHVFDSREARELGQRCIAWLQEHATDLSAFLGQRVASSGASAARAAFSTAATIGSIIFQAVLTALFFFFLSTAWARVLEFGDSFIPHAQRGRALEILAQMDRAIAGFVRGRVTIALLLMGYFSLAYWLAGVPMPLLLGPVIGMLCIVPYVQMIGIPIAMLLLWLSGVHGPIVAPNLFDQGNSFWWILLAPPVIHFCGHALDDYLLNPVIQGKHTELSVPTIVFASIAGGALAGVYGLLVAIPFAACLRILMKEVFWPRVQAWVRGEAKDVLPIGRE